MTGAEPRIALVVAVAANGVIGKDGKLPWHISSDLKFFRNITMGKPIVMGRKTYESIGKPLDGRDNIVITRNAGYQPEGVIVASNVEDALSIARKKAAARGSDEISVIGGAQIYGQTLPIADVIYLTEVHDTPDGDAFFPEIDRLAWKEVSRERFEAGPRDNADYSIVVLERIQDKPSLDRGSFLA